MLNGAECQIVALGVEAYVSFGTSYVVRRNEGMKLRAIL